MLAQYYQTISRILANVCMFQTTPEQADVMTQGGRIRKRGGGARQYGKLYGKRATYCCNVFGPRLHILSLKYIHLFCEKQTKIYRSGFVFFKFYSVQIHLPHCSRTDSEPQPVLGRGNKMLSWFWMSYVLFHCSPLVWTEGTFNSAGCFCLVRAAATVSLRPGVLRVMTLFTLSDIEEVK